MIVRTQELVQPPDRAHPNGSLDMLYKALALDYRLVPPVARAVANLGGGAPESNREDLGTRELAMLALQSHLSEPDMCGMRWLEGPSLRAVEGAFDIIDGEFSREKTGGTDTQITLCVARLAAKASAIAHFYTRVEAQCITGEKLGPFTIPQRFSVLNVKCDDTDGVSPAAVTTTIAVDAREWGRLLPRSF